MKLGGRVVRGGADGTVDARVVLTVVAALAVPCAMSAQSIRFRPDERVVIGDFSSVQAIAADEATLYVATRGGLGVYDRRFGRWQPPVASLDGYPAERVHAALVDAADGTLWLGTDRGLVRYQPVLARFDDLPVGGGVLALMFDAADPFAGLYLRTPAGWRFLTRGGIVPVEARSLPPPARRRGTVTVDEVIARYPFAQAMEPLALSDERLRRHRYTAAAVAPNEERVFLGTDGLGVLWLDPLTASLERMPFGLLADDAGAVVVVPGGVWVGTGRRSARSGFTFVRDDLQEYHYTEGPRATGFGFRAVHDLMARGGELWAGTDRGVARFDAGGRGAAGAAFVPDDVYALAQGPSGAWLGTARGLLFVAADGTAVRVGDTLRDAVFALAAARDTVWLGGPRGLGVAVAGAAEVKLAGDAARTPELRATIVAVTLSADTVVAATRERLLWRAPDTGAWTVERPIAGELGEISTVAPEAGGVWVGGARGIALFQYRGSHYQFLVDPRDLPGAVRDIAVAREYLWVATDRGLVRVSKRAIRP